MRYIFDIPKEIKKDQKLQQELIRKFCPQLAEIPVCADGGIFRIFGDRNPGLMMTKEGIKSFVREKFPYFVSIKNRFVNKTVTPSFLPDYENKDDNGLSEILGFSAIELGKTKKWECISQYLTLSKALGQFDSKIIRY